MLQVIVFVCGAALMALEMLGSRFLAPQFGNSIFVWGSLIGVVLAALSVGYYAGGYLADRRPHLGSLALVPAAAGVWIWALPTLAGWLSPWVAALDYGPRLSVLLACLALFAGPSVLLALTSPWALRLAAREIHTVGSTAGLLYAVSTAGSIAGTLVTAFFLIPAYGVATLTHGLGLALVGLAATAFVAVRRPGTAAAAVAMAVVMTAVAFAGGGRDWLPPPSLAELPPPPGGTPAATVTEPPATAATDPPATAATEPPAAATESTSVAGPAVGEVQGPRTDGIIYRKESLYHSIRVQNDRGSRYLRFDNSYQSGMYLDDPLRTRFEYTDYLLLPFALRPEASRALLVGLGGGSIVKKLLAQRPQLRLDVAELDPEVVTVARAYFGVPQNPRLEIAEQDGRQYLRQTDRAYDVVMLDAYYAEAIPFHLTTREFMAQVRARLAPGGIVAANVIGALEGPKSSLTRSMVRTLAAVFPQVYVFPVGDNRPTDYQNVIVVAVNAEERLTVAEIVKRAQGQGPGLGIPDLKGYAERIYTKPLPLADVPVLSDDYAPVDSLRHLYR